MSIQASKAAGYLVLGPTIQRAQVTKAAGYIVMGPLIPVDIIPRRRPLILP